MQNSNVSSSPGRTKMVRSETKRFYGSPQGLFVADYPSENKRDNLQNCCFKHGYLAAYSVIHGLHYAVFSQKVSLALENV